MESHELLREVFEKCNVKQIAAELGLSQSLIYKWAEADESGVFQHVAELRQRVLLSKRSKQHQQAERGRVPGPGAIVIHQDFIRTARTKGLHERTVIMSHALRNALIPVVTVVGAQLSWLITGSFIVEYMFAIPGLGQMFVLSATSLDYPLIMGLALFYAAVVAAMLTSLMAYLYLGWIHISWGMVNQGEIPAVTLLYLGGLTVVSLLLSPGPRRGLQVLGRGRALVWTVGGAGYVVAEHLLVLHSGSWTRASTRS